MVNEQGLLAELGRRLRLAREGEGLGVSELARQAGLSRRHITEAEAGRANLTILKLARLASCLRTPLRDLCDLGAAARGERLALVGLRGAGKSSVGRALAAELEAPFVELDQRVEELAGVPLGEVFDLQGTEAYRSYEAEALESLLGEGQRMVIATGGSLPTAPATYSRLRETCNTVWLRAEPEDHLQRVMGQGDQRPMAGRPRALDELRGILSEREDLYGLCDLELNTSTRSVHDLVAETLSWFRERAAL